MEALSLNARETSLLILHICYSLYSIRFTTNLTAISDTPSEEPVELDPSPASSPPQKAAQSDSPVPLSVKIGIPAALANWLADDNTQEATGPVTDVDFEELKTTEYSSITDVLSRLTFSGEMDTGANLSSQVSLYQEIYSGPQNQVYYHDGLGNILHTTKLPANWDSLSSSERNDWHNNNRQEILGSALVLPDSYEGTGYPLISTSRLPGIDTSDDSSIRETTYGRSQEMISYDKRNLSYFEGESMTVLEAIERVCDAYDVSFEVAIGIAGNESSFDRDAKSNVGALGLFQFMPGAMKDAKDYMDRHPELGAKIRKGNFPLNNTYKKNRFVQMELFCAYFLHLQDLLSAKSNDTHATLQDLEERLLSLDPGFSYKGLQEISAINAFHSGATRIRKCIKHFIDLSDEEIIARIGPSPYGVDVWPAILANAMGKEGGVKRQVFEYVPRVLAMSSVVRGESEFYLEEYGREKTPIEPKKPKSKAKGSIASLSAVIASVSGIIRLLSKLTDYEDLQKAQPKKGKGQGPTRRKVLAGLFGGGLLLASPMLDDAVSAVTRPTSETPEEPEDEPIAEPVAPSHEITIPADYEQVYTDAQAGLESLYDTLSQKKRISRMPSETNDVRRSLQGPRFLQLSSVWKKMLGEKGYQKVRKNHRVVSPGYFSEASALQQDYLDDEITKGNLVPMAENDPSKPYFCEQVGKTGGTSNNPDMMYMHAAFEPITELLVELVNAQIERFNSDTSAFGVKSFPTIPPVDAFKISGALRTLEYAKKLRRTNSTATESLSDHSSGQAIDIASYATPKGHMARFREPMLDKDGVTQIPAGGMLGDRDAEFGKKTREYLSTFVGRALIAMQEPLKEHHDIGLEVRWERDQRNWHIMIHKLD
jgi:hypothetical protein